jgi:hypothetical protein
VRLCTNRGGVAYIDGLLDLLELLVHSPQRGERLYGLALVLVEVLRVVTLVPGLFGSPTLGPSRCPRKHITYDLLGQRLRTPVDELPHRALALAGGDPGRRGRLGRGKCGRNGCGIRRGLELRRGCGVGDGRGRRGRDGHAGAALGLAAPALLLALRELGRRAGHDA